VRALRTAYGAATIPACDPHQAGDAGGVQVVNPQDVAGDLIVAERERTAIGQFSDLHPDFDLDTAYRAQQAFVQSKLDAGERLVGYKLGLTSRNKQVAMGVDAPLYGRVTSGMIRD
jgi:2-oxo-3-hexenedioate decarboxylase